MAKKDKDKKRAAKERKWEAEKQQFDNFKAKSPQIKALVRAKGCNLPFYEFLDSYEDEFHAIVKGAAIRFPSLIGAFELDNAPYIGKDYQPYGIGANWTHLTFNDEDPLAETYNDPDSTANINGQTIAFLNPDGDLKTLVLIQRQVKCKYDLRDYKYHYKLIALCHELGHVDDLEKRINFDLTMRSVNIIDAEVYAHLFALTETNRRALFTVADTLEATLGNYKETTDYRGEVSRLVLGRYQRPERKNWQAYDLAK